MPRFCLSHLISQEYLYKNQGVHHQEERVRGSVISLSWPKRRADLENSFGKAAARDRDLFSKKVAGRRGGTESAQMLEVTLGRGRKRLARHHTLMHSFRFFPRRWGL